MRKRLLTCLTGLALVLASCSCPSSYLEVPAPGAVRTVGQVQALTHCQIKLYGATLLGLAPSAEVAQALLDRGADPNGRLIINGKEYRGNAMVLVTNPAVVAVLAHAGCSADVQGGPENVTPLCNAIRHGDSRLAISFLAAGANPNRVDSHGETPLFLAASRLVAPLCQVLINQGARVDAGRYADGTTPLMAALQAGGSPEAMLQPKLEVAELLLAAGANHLQPDAQGNFPMHVAPVELMPRLMAFGASVNCTNARGRTPLFFGGGRSRVEFLLQHGVDVNARDVDGNTAFDVVTDPSIRSYILSRGGCSGKAI